METGIDERRRRELEGNLLCVIAKRKHEELAPMVLHIQGKENCKVLMNFFAELKRECNGKEALMINDST